MYAIFETGGKQYRVETGDIIDVELLEGDENQKVEFKNVLFLSTGSGVKIGKPHIQGGIVVGELLQEIRGPKLLNFKYKKRKNYRRKVGHRQNYSRIKITEIKG